MVDTQYLNSLRTVGRKWTQGAINYFFSDDGDEAWAAHEKAAYGLAIQSWANVANFTVAEVSSQSDANFVEYLRFSLPSGHANHGLPAPGGSDAADHVDGNYWTNWGAWTANGLKPGGNAFEAIVHELGHGFGLLHPHDAPVFPGVSDSGDTGDNALNQHAYTVMSYVHGNISTNTNDYGHVAGPMAFDIAAVQSLYGANMSFNTGYNVYSLPDSNVPGTAWRCIWDAGGTDEIRYTGSRDATIDLTAATLDNSATGGGVLSQANGIFGGYTIAHGVVIENATGGSGNDTINGNHAANYLIGGAGNDEIIGRGGNDELQGQDGDDQIWGSAGNDRLYGGAGWDRISGGAGNDLIGGGEGGDHLFGNGGADQIVGYNGDDWIVGHSGNDALFGNDGNDRLEGGEGEDNLSGGNGDDWLSGGGGQDSMNGGDGIDTLDLVYWDGDSMVDLAAGTATFPGFYVETVLNIENVVLGAGDDTVVGSAAANLLAGGGGRDRLSGGEGSDILLGGDGGDWLIGGGEMDYLDGGAGRDTADWSYIAARSRIDLKAGTAEFLDFYTETIVSIENVVAGDAVDWIFGTGGRNILRGGGGDDVVNGRGGADRIFGASGRDSLLGKGGNDKLFGGKGNDRLDGAPATTH